MRGAAHAPRVCYHECRRFPIERKAHGTIDTITNILQENLDIDPSTVTAESTFDSLGIDSLDMVELICDLEEACEVDFGEPEGLNTVGDLVAYVDSL